MTRMAQFTLGLLVLAGPPGDHQDPSLRDLLDQFKITTGFSRQLDLAKEIAKAGDVRVLKELEPSLGLEDRHLRGNAAFIFAALGDERGFETIREILSDRSSRELGQGIPGAPSNPNAPFWWLTPQIQADRYYAVHLLGELRDMRGVDMLVPLLTDRAINYKVAWALGQIGDKRAVAPLIGALDSPDALVRVSAIQALVTLEAREALPRLRQLVNDEAMPRAGDQVSVGERAKAAIETLVRQRSGPAK